MARTATQMAERQQTAVASFDLKDLNAMEELINRYSLKTLNTKGRLERTILLAEGIAALREATGPIMPKIMPLMNCRLGFLTDRDPNRPRRGETPAPYPVQVVQECLIEALLRGFYPVGNEFNILAGNCYGTKEGYTRLVRDLPGLTDLHINPAVPVIRNGGAIVRVLATWKIEGKRQLLLDEEDKPGRWFGVRADASSGIDFILGKAERKALGAIHRQVTGSQLGDDGDESEVIEGTATPTQALAGRGPAAQLDRPEPTITAEQAEHLARLSEGMDRADVEKLSTSFGNADPLKLTRAQAEKLLRYLADEVDHERRAEREAIQAG